MFDSRPPRLLHALLLSLAIHAVLLLAVVDVFPTRLEMPSATIKAELSSGVNHRVAPTAVAHAPKNEGELLRPSTPVRSKMSARPPIIDEPSLAALPPPTVSAVPAEPVNTSPVVAGSRPSSISAQNPAPELPHEAVNADGLREYRISLAIAARRFKRYPALARERGWEGTTEIALLVSSRLPALEVILLRSSGHPVLDRQAQEMMNQAAQATVLPESLRGRDLRIVLPVKFSLEADQ